MAPPPPPVVVPPPPAPLVVPQGFWMLVWQLPNVGGIDGLIAKSKQLGIDGIFLKAADGGSRWEGQFTKQNVDLLHQAGLKVVGWQYVYGGPGNNAPVYSTVQAETDAGVWVMDQGADGYLTDPEDEIVGKVSAVIAECQGFRAHYPHASFGYNPYPDPDSQPMQPWWEWNNFVDYCMPQVYQRADWNISPTAALAKMEASFAKWSPQWAARAGGRAAQPIILDWQTTSWGANPTPDSDILEAATVTKAHGYEGMSGWDLDSETLPEMASLVQAVKIFKGL